MVTIFVFIVMLGVGYRIYEYYQWKPMIEKNNNFIEVWGTYSYKDFDNYPERVKPYISDELFITYFKNEQSLAIREGRMITQDYSIKTEILETIKKEKSNELAIFETKIKETISSKLENSTTERVITVTWDYEDKEKPLVKDIKYE